MMWLLPAALLTVAVTLHVTATGVADTTSNDVTVRCTSCRNDSRLVGEEGGSIALRYTVMNKNFKSIQIKYNNDSKNVITATYKRDGVTTTDKGGVNTDNVADKRFVIPETLTTHGPDVFVLDFKLSNLSTTEDDGRLFFYERKLEDGSTIEGSNALMVKGGSGNKCAGTMPPHIVLGLIGLVFLVVAVIIIYHHTKEVSGQTVSSTRALTAVRYGL